MDPMEKLILEIGQRARDAKDPQVEALMAGTITDVDFIKGLTPESPFYIRNGVLTTVDDPAIVEEIKRMQAHMAANPPGIRVDGNAAMAKESEILKVFPELAPAYQAVKDALNDAKCVGCARNRELAKMQDAFTALHRAEHASGRVRDVSGMAGVAGQTFVDAWAKPPPSPDAPVNLARMSWAPTKSFEQVGKHLQTLQSPVSLTPPGRKLAAPPPMVPPAPKSNLLPNFTPPPPKAAFKSDAKTISIPMPPPDAALNQVPRPDLPGGMRKHCFDCYGKHLMQAQVLLKETLKGYPEHAWLAVGHLAEAEDEILAADASLADLARSARLAVMRDPLSAPDLMPLMRLCLERREEAK